MLFRPRMEKDPASFVQVLSASAHWQEAHGEQWLLSLNQLHSFQAQSRTLTSFIAWRVVGAQVEGQTFKDLALLVSCDFFSFYGLERPTQGRLFKTSDCTAETSGAVPLIISEQMWHYQYLSDPAIIGTHLRVNRRLFEIVGVTPRDFPGRLRGNMWIPYPYATAFYGGRDMARELDTPWLTLEGRLRPGVSHADARAELTAIAGSQLLLTNGSFAQHPAVRATMLSVTPLVMGAVSLILLLACTNVVMLLLSRAAARRQEIAIRRALGADRQRLIRMLLTEGLLLSSSAGILSAILARWIPATVERILWRAPHYPVQADWVTFSYLAGVTIVAGCVAGLAPAAESFRSDLTPSLKKDPRFAGRSRWKATELQLGAMVAMSLVLLTGAALFVRAQFTMYRADPGFETRQTMVTKLHASPSADYREMAERIRALPGVESMAFASMAPFSDRGSKTAVNYVTPGFFATIGIPVVAGREFNGSDERAVVVSESYGAQLGAIIDGFTVIGVARDTAYSQFGGENRRLSYRLQGGANAGGNLIVRYSGDFAAVSRSVANALDRLDPEQTAKPYTPRAEINEMAARFSTLLSMVLFLGAVALLLAIVGVYGMVAFAVSQRAKELAIRVALGAQRGDVIRCVIAPGIAPIAAGVFAGLMLSLGGSALLAQLFKRSPMAFAAWDPVSYTVICVVLTGAALLAMFLPARRAAGADPAEALRQE